MSDKLRGYAHRVDIGAGADKIWQALTQSEHLGRWCASGAAIKAKQGGLFRARVDRVVELEAYIDIYDPARRLRLIYLPAKDLPHADSTLIDDFILDATPTDTIVRLLGSGIPSTPEWDAQYRRSRMAWQAAMTRLKVFVERQMADDAA